MDMQIESLGKYPQEENLNLRTDYFFSEMLQTVWANNVIYFYYSIPPFNAKELVHLFKIIDAYKDCCVCINFDGIIVNTVVENSMSNMWDSMIKYYVDEDLITFLFNLYFLLALRSKQLLEFLIDGLRDSDTHNNHPLIYSFTIKETDFTEKQFPRSSCLISFFIEP
uniref:Uncharacterized protein n=1 Tax=Romanomermis culicivorax TaxID=13658 RepID=A0A915IB09_ROMCU